MDENIVEKLLHDDVGAAEGRAGIFGRREIFRELLDFFDDVACAGML